MALGKAYIIFCFLCGVVAFWKLGPFLEASPATLAGIVSVFSILAGVLVAVISIIGDPSMLLPGNWRVGYVHAQTIQDRIAEYAHLVLIYVIVLVLVLTCTLLQENKVTVLPWAFEALAGLTVFALMLSLPLPYSLMAIQKERMDQEVQRRKSPPGSQD